MSTIFCDGFPLVQKTRDRRHEVGIGYTLCNQGGSLIKRDTSRLDYKMSKPMSALAELWAVMEAIRLAKFGDTIVTDSMEAAHIFGKGDFGGTKVDYFLHTASIRHYLMALNKDLNIYWESRKRNPAGYFNDEFPVRSLYVKSWRPDDVAPLQKLTLSYVVPRVEVKPPTVLAPKTNRGVIYSTLKSEAEIQYTGIAKKNWKKYPFAIVPEEAKVNPPASEEEIEEAVDRLTE